VVLGHHERWDGNGYPFGVKGEDIPIPARIIAVVDVFDALTESRVYHAGESVVTALEELRKGSGTHFDPKVVEAFFDVLQVARHART
jgi:putative two-component system response regulator